MPAPALRLSDIDLDARMRSSYLDYAMSVIVSRALPDARDGMKPVHRRVLYGMYELGLRSTNAYKKSARVVGDVLGKYHPHGDTAVYEALVRMAQDFAMRYPLVDGQGNFGSIDGDSAAAMRYTEVRLTALAEELLADIDKNTVPFADNFDGSMQEPLLLPARVPMLLLNGAAGIAVGMATNIPPHNLNELCAAIIILIDNPDASVEEFVQVMPGPDFPTGGQIVGRDGIDSAYATGSGKITVRATVLVESEQKGRETLVVTELPYQVNKSELIKKIAELARERKIEGIAGLRDESDRNGLRIAIDLKSAASAEKVLAALYQKTNLQVTFGINMLGLLDNAPHTLSLKQSLSAFIEHRRQVITRRVEFDLDEATDRRHILEGLALALKNLDKIIALIRQAKNSEAALKGLMEGFGLSQIQARAILDMQLRRLAALERQKVLDELKEVQKLVAELEAILASPARVLEIMKQDLRDLQSKFGDARRTRIVEQDAAVAPAALADLLPQQQTVVALSFEGYLKRLDTATGRNAGRDPITRYIEANTRDTLYLLSAQGTAFSLPVHRIETVGKRSDRGTSAHALVDLADSDSVAAAVPSPNDEQQRYLVIATKRGMIKRTLLSEYVSARNAGILALRLDEGDSVIAAALTTGQDEIMLSTVQGKVIRFGEDEVRPTGRVAGGVRGIKLADGDSVLPGPLVAPKQVGSLVITLTTKGMGKKTPLSEYPTQGRDGSGVQAARLTPKSGEIAMILFGPPRGGTIECITSDRRVGVIELSEIPARDRSHPGDPLVDSIATASLRPR